MLAAAERGRLARQARPGRAARDRLHAAIEASGAVLRRHRRGRIAEPVNPTRVHRVETAIPTNREKHVATSPDAPVHKQSVDLRG